MIQLNPCPFCGSNNLEVADVGTMTHWVCCKDCNATGPNSKDVELAQLYWNCAPTDDELNELKKVVKALANWW